MLSPTVTEDIFWPKAEVEVVDGLLPAYSRHLRLLGVAMGEAGDFIRVRAYGRVDGPVLGWAFLLRKTGRPQASPRIEEPQDRPADSSDEGA